MLCDQLRAMPVEFVRTAAGLRQVLVALKLVDPGDANLREAALKEFCVSLDAGLTRTLGESEAANGCALERWVDRFILTRGPDLLISEDRRQALLARHRDEVRRHKRKQAERGRGSRAERISMKEEAWDKLIRIQSHLSSGRAEALTMSTTLELLVTEREASLQAAKARHGGTKKISRKRPAEADTRDLFSAREPRP